ncbi:hypothetical protein DAPPUDRAFT_111493 [Daphnia pulex]|uniref:Uncharacterized protein n=1 Tax=Daphnia pulex TaxID=6669 RepID=E9H9D4_DAPPU|nr:hypothetical protein DAPPUDRAFT_111493 [Daphnia pulex]|eukprot:EFX71602.1 hypothetical protein DAPPUDRAFT_111493 [Daphnia pulex]
MDEDKKYLWYCSTDSSLDPDDYPFTVFSDTNSSDEQEAVDGGSENSSHSEAENSNGGKQEPGNVEKSGQETTRPEEKNGGGGSDQGDVSAEVESEDEGPGPSKSRNFKKLRSGKRKNETGFPLLSDTSSSSNEQEAEDGGDDSKNGQQVTGAAGENFDNEDAVEVEVESQNEKAKSTPRLSSQAKRNLRKKILKRQGRKKPKVESDHDPAEKFKEHCNSSDEGQQKSKYSKKK